MPLIRELQEEYEDEKGNAEEDVLIQSHHEFMLEYGWIPLKEFAELPIPTYLNLKKLINEKRKREQKQIDDAKGNK